ncbi:MAG TPA: Crp/Fnr family transcriptional regulator [Chthonomonadaceae bacterium]|nr:Crp/Fnr family transcriptional regulator [Chthonomonadaceae bacterium]
MHPFAYYSNPAKILELLEAIPLFEGVEDDVKRLFAETCRPRSKPANRDLVSANDPPRFACIIISGLVRVESDTHSGETETFFAYRGPSQHLGVSHVVLNMNYNFTSRTLTPCCYLEIGQAELVRCYDASKRLNRNVLAYYMERLYAEFEHRERMVRLSKPGLVTATFLQIAEATETQLVSDIPNLRRLEWLKQEILESQLHTTHPTVSAAYGYLRQRQAISGGTGVNDPVTILDEQALRDVLALQ